MHASDRFVALCYHDVLPSTRAAGGGAERFAVPTAMFERMLDTIRALEHRGCSLEVAIRSAGERRVAITFDDATESQYLHAMPALRARGMTATVYAVPRWVGRPGYMSWDQLREIRAWGMSVQSHSYSHPFLSECDRGQLRSELRDSKAEIDRELGQDTTEIAFPGGDPPRLTLRGELAAAGYTVHVGTRWGINVAGRVGRPFVQRCTVRGDVSEEDARRYVLGDRWMAAQNHPKETFLRSMRATLGPTRYARWRRRFLDTVNPRRRDMAS